MLWLFCILMCFSLVFLLDYLLFISQNPLMVVLDVWNRSEACVVQWWCNGLPCDGLGFNSRSEQCIYWASRPSQGTVNGGAVSKWPRCRWDIKHNQPKNLKQMFLDGNYINIASLSFWLCKNSKPGWYVFLVYLLTMKCLVIFCSVLDWTRVITVFH